MKRTIGDTFTDISQIKLDKINFLFPRLMEDEAAILIRLKDEKNIIPIIRKI